MIGLEIFIVIAGCLLIGGPLAYFGMRRWLRWMGRIAEQEEQRDEKMFHPR